MMYIAHKIAGIGNLHSKRDHYNHNPPSRLLSQQQYNANSNNQIIQRHNKALTRTKHFRNRRNRTGQIGMKNLMAIHEKRI